ncbi:MAG: Acetylornithine deacetylase [Hyphomicrobiales bacterium]|nr:Acetylornithine deacetylase [Hyphomicrobiales bacterium]
MAPDADHRLTAAIDLLERLVAFDTESSKSNLALVAYVESVLAAHDVPYVVTPNATGDKAAIFATIGPMIDGGIILSGHTDVVPVAGQTWTGDPFSMRREGARLYGRGTTDMKGFDAVCLAMIEEFKRAPLKKPIHILLSYDEETTCAGPLDTIARFGVDLPRPAAVIVGEPTLMEVADAHKSIATFQTIVHGLEAHSSKPHLGANAIEGAAALVHDLYRFAEELAAGAGGVDARFDPPSSTLSVGTIHGGTARNILAKECAFHWEFRGLPGAPQDLALRRLAAFADEVVAPRLRRFAPDARVETIVEVEVPGLCAQNGSPAETLALKLTRSNQTIAVPYATEAGRFQAAGMPAIVCGPGSIDQAHQPDEFIEIAQLRACIGFMRALAAELS